MGNGNTGGVSNSAQTFDGPKGFTNPLRLPVYTSSQLASLSAADGGVQGAVAYNSTTNALNICVHTGTWTGVQGAS